MSNSLSPAKRFALHRTPNIGGWMVALYVRDNNTHNRHCNTLPGALWLGLRHLR